MFYAIWWVYRFEIEDVGPAKEFLDGEAPTAHGKVCPEPLKTVLFS